NQLITPILCVLVYYFCLKLGFSLRTSFLMSAIYGLGTTAWTGAHEYFQHPLETLFLFAAVYALFSRRAELRIKDSLIAGLFFALGLLTRFNLVLTLPALVLYLSWLLLAAPATVGPMEKKALAERATTTF